MEQIIITPKTEQEMLFVMEFLKRMNIKTTPLHSKKMSRKTMEEFYAEINLALDDIREGRTISQEEMEKRIKSWQ